MSDWQPGDLALCVNTGATVRAGEINTVTGVDFEDGAVVGLYLAGKHSTGWSGGYKPQRFRKIRPHTPDAEDRRTIALLNGKPVRECV